MKVGLLRNTGEKKGLMSRVKVSFVSLLATLGALSYLLLSLLIVRLGWCLRGWSQPIIFLHQNPHPLSRVQGMESDRGQPFLEAEKRNELPHV